MNENIKKISDIRAQLTTNQQATVLPLIKVTLPERQPPVVASPQSLGLSRKTIVLPSAVDILKENTRYANTENKPPKAPPIKNLKTDGNTSPTLFPDMQQKIQQLLHNPKHNSKTIEYLSSNASTADLGMMKVPSFTDKDFPDAKQIL